MAKLARPYDLILTFYQVMQVTRTAEFRGISRALLTSPLSAGDIRRAPLVPLSMSESDSFPWPGLVLAAIVSVALAIVGVNIWLALAVFMVWCGSIWLTASNIEDSAPPVEDSSLDTDRMAELIEFAGTPLILTDLNRIAIANRAARKALGSHIVGQDVRVALRHPDALKLIDKNRNGSALIRGMARRRDIWRISRQRLDGGLAVIELINRTSAEDIGRAHTDFVANASHELRTPLASIIGYVETLEDSGEEITEDTRQKFRRTILREARRLQQLVSDLMSLSRIEAEKHSEPSDRIELSELVERAARDAAGMDRMGRLVFELQCRPEIQGDIQQLEQLVRNLVDNALKYGRIDGKVAIALEMADSDRAVLTVRDTGEGIPAEHLPHLTRRFYRTDPGRSRASGGTGLGLAIVKHIVERHRGKLDIASKLGKGTTITVRLPAQSSGTVPEA
ncbi:ATP-binding protein [Sphingomonadaceae bacterium]|nr:ATP-binding protein [Sphingomonadaceae bacterium]